jgi:prevent-host-death family protein
MQCHTVPRSQPDRLFAEILAPGRSPVAALQMGCRGVLAYESFESYNLQVTTYTLSEARAHLGKVVNRARYGGEIVELTEHGQPAAVVISPERLAYYRRLEDARDLAEAERVTSEGRPTVPHAEVAARFGLGPDGRTL